MPFHQALKFKKCSLKASRQLQHRCETDQTQTDYVIPKMTDYVKL